MRNVSSLLRQGLPRDSELLVVSTGLHDWTFAVRNSILI